MALREVIRIDEEKCDGCGECVPSCHEGAIAIVGGKARIVSETLCDGLGACLGKCPRGAIAIEERPAPDFDPAEVARRLAAARPRPALRAAPHDPHGAGGCPGAAFRELPAFAAPHRPPAPAAPPVTAASGSHGDAPRSRLSHWPVQLALVPPAGRIWQGADVLIAADCVPFALAGFHERLLAGRSLAIACPKLDDVEPHVEKLSAIFGGNDIRSIAVAIMEVPCCRGLLRVVEEALALSGRTGIPLETVVVGVQGGLVGRS